MNEQAQTDSQNETPDPDAPIVVIGITGNIGSGKSTVANYLREAGHTVFSSDETARRLMNEDSELKELIRRNFGEWMYDAEGSIVAPALAGQVFGSTPQHHARLAMLNRLVHPRVLDEHQRQISECEEAGLHTVFIESALIYEVGLEEAFDYIVVVDAKEDVRIQRAMLRAAQSEQEVRDRMRAQMSASEKTKNADFIVQNDSTLEVLNSALNALVPILVLLPPRSADDEDEEIESQEETGLE